MNGRVKDKDMTPVFDVRHICTYLLLTRVYVQEQYFWLVRCCAFSLVHFLQIPMQKMTCPKFFVFNSIPIFGEKSQWRVPDWNIELSVCR
jgi:hypothetical protein